MKIASKIVLASTLLCSVAVVLAGMFVGWKASQLSEEALFQRATNQLTSVREIKKSEIEQYFQQIRGQIVTAAHSVGIEDAMLAFSDAFQEYPVGAVGEEDVSRLSNYYRSRFGETYRASNGGLSANALQRLDKLSLKGKALQARYIGVNPNPLGEKHQLMRDTLDTSYDLVHAKYHPSIKGFLEEFGYYDIFLVDTQGNVVYSVFKELDYATNLRSGPYAGSGLASAYKQALNLEGGEYHLEDFSPYYPSYEAAASFIATPITSNGQLSGVLIFQMPVDEIKSIMTFGEDWQYAGLGESGETYLVGSDNLLRSEPRLLIENSDVYYSVLEASGVEQSLLTQIQGKSSAMGRQRLDNQSIRSAFQGESGALVIKGYRGVDVLSVFAPLDAAGLEWVIITEMNKGEALADVDRLVQSNIVTVLMCIAFGVIGSALVSYFLGRSISHPIVSACKKIEGISQENDLRARLNVEGNDEMSDLARSLNGLFVQLQTIIQKFAEATDGLNRNTQSMAGNMNSTRDSVNDQNHRTESVATAVNEMSASIAEVAQFASRAAEFVKNANDTGSEGVKVGRHLGSEIAQLNEEMKTAVDAIGRLHNESNSIAEVLDVIQGIAEQTNLLALNAAIEAARAGEQGRGFAVVADEVRSLAGRTQSSTEEIRNKIEALQRETSSVSNSIENANRTVSQGVDTCDKNTAMLEQIVTMLGDLNEMNIQIAAATEEQKAVTDEISGSITSIADASSAVSAQVSDADQVLQDLSSQSEHLNGEVSQFKY
ncbi:methyl-accepting chemotaxis protein [Vibrio ostreicida]|uniref:methyl-accepting chemotaxis protein n=1 Tax=Vibrio ostreicida TaxID=526588 RepID=UPI00097061AC|nr:methyl-accepting chemotaxis protein [Vibrio ostreicida]